MRLYLGENVYGWRMWGFTWGKPIRFIGLSIAPTTKEQGRHG